MGDAAKSWSAWYREHGAALLLFARQWLPDRADAEDVVQEGFVRFWKSRETAEDATAYLFACVRNSALELQRGRRRRTRREEAAARNEASDPWFECPLECDERGTRIELALQHLPSEQREVLVLKIWGELTFPQIAEALAISPNTAASRYRYALEKLRELLAEVAVP